MERPFLPGVNGREAANELPCVILRDQVNGPNAATSLGFKRDGIHLRLMSDKWRMSRSHLLSIHLVC